MEKAMKDTQSEKIDHNAVYIKDNTDCEYKRILSGISICAWNNTLCRRVPYSLCAKYDEPHEEEENTK